MVFQDKHQMTKQLYLIQRWPWSNKWPKETNNFTAHLLSAFYWDLYKIPELSGYPGYFQVNFRVKISRGAPLEVQNGTQQDLNKMIRVGRFGGQKDCLHAENVGLRNGTQQDLNKIVDMVKFWGAKISSRCRKWGAKPRHMPTDSQRGSAPPPHTFSGLAIVFHDIIPDNNSSVTYVWFEKFLFIGGGHFVPLALHISVIKQKNY